MSQSRNPPDTQALLQSMLQKLKLQPGREGQAYLHTPVPVTAASTWGQDGQGGASHLQKVNRPVNGFDTGTNDIPTKEFWISAADSNFGHKGGVVDRDSLISFRTQKDNIDGDTGENRVFGQAIQPGITATGTGQLFPAKSLKDAEITSFERADGERLSIGSSGMKRDNPSNTHAVTSTGQNQDQDQEQGFRSKVYMWSLNPADVNVDTGSQQDKGLHMGNGGFGASAQSKDMQIVPTDQKTTNSSPRRKQRPSENKTRRWTQKIKERWKDRQGNFGKKGKEEGGGGVDLKSEQGTEVSSAF